jgi:hypothetical protein
VHEIAARAKEESKRLYWREEIFSWLHALDTAFE